MLPHEVRTLPTKFSAATLGHHATLKILCLLIIGLNLGFMLLQFNYGFVIFITVVSSVLSLMIFIGLYQQAKAHTKTGQQSTVQSTVQSSVQNKIDETQTILAGAENQSGQGSTQGFMPAHGQGLNVDNTAAVSDHADVSSLLKELSSLTQSVFRSLQQSQTLGDTTMNALSEDFAALHAHMAHVLTIAKATSQQFNHADDHSFATQSRADLAMVLQALADSTALKDELVHSIDDVSLAASELKQQTVSIQKISKEITLLSLNASIEAARAGDAGRGFAVVAERVRELSDITSEAAALIVGRMDNLQQAVSASGQKLADSQAKDLGLLHNVEQKINHVVSGIEHVTRELNQTVAALDQSSSQVQHQVTAAITDFQFQDRVSQKLTHNIAALEQLDQLFQQPQLPNAEQIAAVNRNLYASFTMQDERRTHQGEQNNDAPKDAEMTFF